MPSMAQPCSRSPAPWNSSLSWLLWNPPCLRLIVPTSVLVLRWVVLAIVVLMSLRTLPFKTV